MINLTKLLAGIFAVQIVAFVMLGGNGDSSSTRKPGVALMNIQPKLVDKITITYEGGVLSLQKKGDKWLIPEKFNFPADTTKVEEMVEKLSQVKVSWPVGKTKIAAKRFKVSEDSFERKLTFQSGKEEEKTLYIGTSPGFKKVHARANEDELTYAIEFSSYEASARPGDWVDKNFYALKKESVTAIKMADFTLESTDKKGFAVEGLAQGEKTNQQEVDSFISKVLNINFEDVLGIEKKPEYKLSEPLLQYTIHTKESEKLTYTISPVVEENKHILKISKYPYYFKVPSFSIDPLKEIKRDALVSLEKVLSK